MLRQVLVLSLVAIALSVSISPIDDERDLLTLQGRSGVPRQWKKLERRDDLANVEISFSIVLRQCNVDKLEEILLDVSNPKSDNYAKYMKLDEVVQLTRCSGDVEKVKEFLASNGVAAYDITAAGFRVTAPVYIVEELLHTKFFEFQHKESNKVYIRQEGTILIPKSLSGSIRMITGISDFYHDLKYKVDAHSQSQKVHRMSPASYDPNAFSISDPYVTPSFIHLKYGIPSFESVLDETNHIGIAAFDNDYDDDALCRFQGLFNDYADPPTVHYMGPEDGSDQIESDLDVQYSTIIAFGAHEVFDNHPPGEWIYEWTQDALALAAGGVYVWSISYGWPEIWQCQGIDNQTITNCPVGYNYSDYIDLVNTEIIKLGTLGVTTFVSSGDDGTPGFAANCPIDPNQYYAAAQTSCGHVFEDPTCSCAELTITYTSGTQSSTCFVPNGILYPSECSDIPTAGLALCEYVFQEFMSTNYFSTEGLYCNRSADSGLTGNIPYFYSNCTCETFTPISKTVLGSTCTLQGYSFDPSNGPAFLPDFPTSSPYVTSVGATAIQFSNECSSKLLVDLPEIYTVGREAAGFSGGGGFSSFQPAQPYQLPFIQTYLQVADGNLPPSTTFNPNNRGYPDIALNGHNYVVPIGLSAEEEGDNPTGLNGAIAAISGTSASSPTTAGIFTLINDYLLLNGRATLGFLNPLLYQLAAERPDSFTDIQAQQLVFNNVTIDAGAFSGCTQEYCCQYGFVVSEGWDPATGLGTPNYDVILSSVNQIWEQKEKK